MEINLNQFKHIHFIGIGGVSMYLLAIYCKELGIEVSGSDIQTNKYTKFCKDKNIKVYAGHKRKNIIGADLVVYTSAIDRHNIEMVEACKQGVKVVDRAELLGVICKNYKYVIGVSGTHGKTTTCAMIYHILRECGKSVSSHIGADILGARFNPNDEYLVLECCEYNRSFLKFNCNVAVVLNIDNDHLDCYQNMYNLRNAFRMFLKRADSRFIFDNPTTKCIKVKANHISPPLILNDNEFSVDGKIYTLNNVYGEHNINNATVAVSVCENFGLNYSKISKALKTFMPAGRRCQKLGKVRQVDVLTDYAHHPSELQCLYKALKLKYNSIYLIFQPHTYSRTKILLNDFISVFKDFENVAIFKEYPARETQSQGVTAKQLSQYLSKSTYINNIKELKNWLFGCNLTERDCIVFVGAGDIDLVGQRLIKEMGCIR